MGENRESRSLSMRLGPTSRNFVTVSMNQRDELSDELISAYFDGELSPDECAHVERLVAGDDLHRQTLVDMQNLADDMRQLPDYQLDEQFAERVTERARRSAAWDQLNSVNSSTTHASHASGAVWNWPAVAGLVAVCAAALLLAVLIWSPRSGQTGPSGAGQVALAPEAAQDNSANNGVATKAQAVHPGSPATEMATQTQQPTADQALIATEPAMAELPPSADLAQTGQAPGTIADHNASNPGPAPSAQLLAGSPDSRAPKSAASMVPTVTPDAPTDSQNLSDVPFATDQQLLFVFEISLTRKGAEQLAFEKMLAKHSVAVDGAVAVDPQLETALLESRYFDPVETDAQAQDKSREPSCSLVYAQILGGQVDEIWRSLQANPGFFGGMSFDMAILPADRTLFENLRQAMSRRPVAQAGTTGREGRPQHAARRLTLPPQWRGKSTNPPPRSPVVEDVPGQPQPSVPLMPGEGLGENIDVEVLFVLHLGPA